MTIESFFRRASLAKEVCGDKRKEKIGTLRKKIVKIFVRAFLALWFAGLIFSGYSLNAVLTSRPHTSEECNFRGHAYVCHYTDLTEEESKLEFIFAVYLYSTPFILATLMAVYSHNADEKDV